MVDTDTDLKVKELVTHLVNEARTLADGDDEELRTILEQTIEEIDIQLASLDDESQDEDEDEELPED